MRRVFWVLFVVVLAFELLCVRTPAQTSIGVTPAWLAYLGNGAAGNASCPSGTCHLTDELWYQSFNVSPGATVVVGSTNGPLVIRATGACTIAGTISNSPNTAAGGGITVNGDFGGGGGGGGGGAAAGLAGLTTVGDGGVPIVNGGAGGAAAGGNGGNALSPVNTQYRLLLSGGSFWPVGASRGGQGGSHGGLGGNGGGPVIFVCNSMNFTGTIDVSGAPGAPATANNSGAGGGGGGGYVILSANSYVANTGVIKTAGGAGGSCNGFTGCGTGGQGGNGWNMAITIQQ